MDWSRLNFDWNRARAFLVTAEEGSLSRASKALQTSQPTLGRQVAALEDELGVLLFDRVGRKLVLTPSGSELLDHVRSMAKAAEQFAMSATGQSQEIEGSISISCGEAISAFLLPKALHRLRTEYPSIEIELIATNDVTDLRMREADIAVRNFRPQQPELIATKIGSVSGHFYAAPSYLETLSKIPSTPEELATLDFIAFAEKAPILEYLQALGVPVEEKNFPLRINSHMVQWELVKAGLGVGVMQGDIGDAEPGVFRIDAGLPDIDVPSWLTVHQELHTSKRVRVVYDLLCEELRATIPNPNAPAKN